MSKQTTLRIIYGTIEKNIDITEKVFNQFVFEDCIVIPPDDNLRAALFTDPCFRIVKHIFVIGMSNSMKAFDHTTGVYIDILTNTIVTDMKRIRKLCGKPFTDPEKKALAIHKHLTIFGGTLLQEFPEQCMIAQYLTGKEKVLEIGGNIGRGSLIIGSLLENDSNFVVLESSPSIANILKKNRNSNNMNFHIESRTLSKRNLIQKGWQTIQSDEEKEGYAPVTIFSYDELRTKYDIEFDTLVLDCEGAFYTILQDFPEILDTIQTIFVENDYRDIEHKKYVDDELRKKDFACVYTKKGELEAKQLGFPCLDNFYEVWKKNAGPWITIQAEPSQFGGKFLEKYPAVLLLRHDRYKSIDSMFQTYSGSIHCTIQIVDNAKDLMKMFDVNYPILVTYGEEKEYVNEVNQYIVARMRKRWIHLTTIESVDSFVQKVNYCYIDNAIADRVKVRPDFSIFTTCYNSYDKIQRAYNSIVTQTFRDWEWVILDDSPDDAHFVFLSKLFQKDTRVRLFKRSHNSGNIGNVKNEAVSLCRGKYVLEMDHDDEILKDVLADAVRAFEEDAEVGFVYMDFINVYENLKNFWYSDFICKGYGGYYMQKYDYRWVEVYMTPNVNNITLSHIVCLPNHPRIWRSESLAKLGNYSEFLPICDDQELLMRTAMGTKIAKVQKLGYVQYMNDNNNNFSLLRNKEINRLGPQYIVPQFYAKYKVHEKMKELGAYENEDFITNCMPIWKREGHEHKYCNKRIQYDYDRQYCILGIDAFKENLEQIEEVYLNQRNDFILLDGKGDKQRLCDFLDSKGFGRMKCYSLPDTPNEQLLRYFHTLYKSCEQVIVLEESALVLKV